MGGLQNRFFGDRPDDTILAPASICHLCCILLVLTDFDDDSVVTAEVPAAVISRLEVI
jgi:hypothetical protein